MANSILKLTVESSEYDAKLKKAAEGIRHLAEVAHRGGGDLTGLEKAELDYIKALGDMETKSRSASGKLRELSSVYKELTVTYNELNEVEKADEGGKALAASLEKLKQRAQEAQAQMDAATKSLQSNTTAGNEDSSMLSKLADKFTINIDALKLFNIGLKAADGALQVAKDAFFSSEQNVDEWGRIIASSQSLYEGFVTSLNNSDFTGFMSRIDDIVKAAREAYNELDRLGTMRTIQAPQIERQNSENVRMRTMLMTGRYIAPSDGRAPLQGMKTGDLLSPAQIKTLERQLQGGMNTIVKLTQNELDQTGRAIDAYYNKLAKENGMTMEEFKKGTSSMAEFDQRQEGYRKYQQWRQENSFTDMYGNRQVREGNPYQEFKKWGTFRVDKMGENSYNDLVGLIRQQQQQQSQIYSTIGQAYRTINRAEGVTVKGLMNPGGGGGRGGSGGGKTETVKTEEQLNNEEIQKLTQEYIKASDDRRKAIEGEIKTLQDRNAEIKRLMEAAQGKVAPEGSRKALNEELSKLQREGQLLSDPIDIELNDQAIKDVQDEIDRLNGKKVEIELAVDDRTPFEKLKDSLKIEIAEENMQVDTTTLQTLMKTAIQNGIDGLDPQFASLQEKMREGMNIPDSAWEDLQTQINEKLKELGIEPIKIDFTTGNIAKAGKETEKSWQAAAQAVQTVGSAMSSIEDPAAKVAGTVMQAVASIALGYAQATTQAASLGPWAWVAFAATGLATMLSTISSIHSATGYSEGGMIKGNSYSGDLIPANGGMIGLNAGEVVLNRAQQNTLASELQGSGGGSDRYMPSFVSGEQIWIALNAYTKRTGKGELVTWR